MVFAYQKLGGGRGRGVLEHRGCEGFAESAEGEKRKPKEEEENKK
jgi:hypothetical protein